MKNIRFIILSLFIASTFSCEKVVEGINDNPNNISSDNFDAGVLLLKGIELANISVQVGHQNRIAGMWSGQTTGAVLLYKSIYEYNLSAEETDGIWQNAYQGVVKQARLLREHTAGSPKAAQLSGIAKVLEANAMSLIVRYPMTRYWILYSNHKKKLLHKCRPYWMELLPIWPARLPVP